MKISILGDSISTYTDYNPIGYSVFYDDLNQRKNGINSVDDTWWFQLINYFNLELCSNNSYSGSQVAKENIYSTNNINRLYFLQKDGVVPDIIIIYIGCNDYFRGTKIKNSRFNVDVNCFYDAYNMMLKNIKRLFPNSTIVCGTLMKSYIKDYDNFKFPENYCGIPFNNYNDTIKKVAKKNGCFVIDLDSQNIKYETLDGTHPTKLGHAEICKAWVQGLLKEPNILHNIRNRNNKTHS